MPSSAGPTSGSLRSSTPLLGQERAIVSEIPGTTRDSVDALLEEEDRSFRIVDTAGIRRKARTERGPEVLSVVAARKRIEDCDVALLVVDASAPPSGQDASVASYVNEAGKGLVLVANKWDLVPGTASGAKDYAEALADKVPFARHAPILLVSAMTGRGVGRVLDAVERVSQNRRRRISTGELNRVLGRALRDKAPRTAAGRNLRVLYVAQTGARPPDLHDRRESGRAPALLRGAPDREPAAGDGGLHRIAHPDLRPRPFFGGPRDAGAGEESAVESGAAAGAELFPAVREEGSRRMSLVRVIDG